MTLPCRLSFDATECWSSAYGFPQFSDCETTNDCFYSNGQFTPATSPCELTDTDHTRCQGIGAAAVHPGNTGYTGPKFCVRMQDDDYLADLTHDSWMADSSEVRWFLKRSSTVHTFNIQPCAPEKYCEGNYWLKWMSRMFVRDIFGWAMTCNQVEQCVDPNNCDQLVEKTVDVALMGDIGMSFMYLAAGAAPSCWVQADFFCFIRNCSAYPEVDCVGETTPAIADNVNQPDFSSTARLSTNNAAGEEYPYSSPQAFRVQLINAAWEGMNAIVDRLDNPGHGGSQKYDSASMSQWLHSEGLADTVVQGTATHYDAYNGVDIPLKARDYMSRLELDAVLTLTDLSVLLYMYAETSVDGSDTFQRLTASCKMLLGVRVKLTSAAPAGLTLLNAGDPYDLRLQKDGSPGVEHETRKLIVVGPNEERVLHQGYATPATPHYLRWEGLKTDQSISSGPDTFVASACSGACCDVLQNIEDSPIPGRSNDNTQLDGGVFTPKEQRFDGFIFITPRNMLVQCGC